MLALRLGLLWETLVYHHKVRKLERKRARNRRAVNDGFDTFARVLPWIMASMMFMALIFVGLAGGL